VFLCLILSTSLYAKKLCFISGSSGLEKDVGCNCLKQGNCAKISAEVDTETLSELDPALAETIKQGNIAADAAMRGDQKAVDAAVAKLTTKENIERIQALYEQAKKDFNSRRAERGLPPIDFEAKHKEMLGSLRKQVSEDIAKGNTYGYTGSMATASTGFGADKLRVGGAGATVGAGRPVFNEGVRPSASSGSAAGYGNMDEYDVQMKDITQTDVPIFKIISSRYMQSFFPRVLDSSDKEKQPSKKHKK